MAENSNIEWCDHSINFWSGCAKVSPACANCYAEALAKRNTTTFGKWGRGEPRSPHLEGARAACLKWSRAQFRARLKDPAARRPRVFVNSMSDWLDDEVPVEWLACLLETIYLCRNLDFLLLTKRPENFHTRLFEVTNSQYPFGKEILEWKHFGVAPPNVWIGTTVENQQWAEERIPPLLEIPAKFRFLSCEPLLGQLEINHIRVEDNQWFPLQHLHWVICGGESGSSARPMHPDWARSLRDQCAAAGVPFFFKQWGEFAPCEPPVVTNIQGKLQATGKWRSKDRYVECRETNQWVKRVGKKTAGRLLDGREWNEFPDPQSPISNLQSPMPTTHAR